MNMKRKFRSEKEAVARARKIQSRRYAAGLRGVAKAARRLVAKHEPLSYRDIISSFDVRW